MASLNLRGTLTILICLGQLFSPVHTLPVQAETPPESTTPVAVSTKTSVSQKLTGIASYYATRYNGRRTTSGQRYNPQKMTGAHPSLPLGTKVRVVNLTNDREVVVTINDRCRKRKHPFIDLSRKAAERLGFLGKGIAKVTISTMDEES